jgi:hypothetical protein
MKTVLNESPDEKCWDIAAENQDSTTIKDALC